MNRLSLRALDLACVTPALIAGLVLLGRVHAFVTDDAAITLRYAVHLVEGRGLRWDLAVAHPVEGYSNFSHVLLGASAWSLQLPALQSLRVLNQAGALLACVCTYGLARRLLGSAPAAGAAALLLGVHAPLWYWASSGLETGVYVAAVYASLWAFRSAAPGSFWPVLPFLLAALTRFEGPVVFAACALACVLAALHARSTAPLRAHGRWGLLFLLLYGGYFAFRWIYFGHPLPNTAYYKRAERFDTLLLSQFAEQCWPLLALAALARFRALGSVSVALLALLALHAVGFLGVAPSVAYFHRFFLPVVPALAILAASALQRVWHARPGRPTQVVAVVLLLAALGLDVGNPRGGFADVSGAVDSLNSRIVARAHAAAFIARHFGRNATVAAEDVGVIGYVLPNRVLDLLGLNDERYVHKMARQRVPHAVYQLLERPEVIALVSKRADAYDAQYAPGKLLVRVPGFSRHYTHVYTASAALDRYHCFVFARNDVPERVESAGIALDARSGVALGVDRLARAARR